jgi:hypothetical protein
LPAAIDPRKAKSGTSSQGKIAGERASRPDFRAIANKVAIDRSLKPPGYISYAYSLKKRSTKSESDHAIFDANLTPAERFEHVSDIWEHAPGRVRRLIEKLTMEFDGSSKQSFRTSVSKAIGKELYEDRTFLNGFRWGKYVESHIGPAPLVRGQPMFDKHGHHKIFQKWLETQDPLVREAHELLWSAGIDPLFGMENLGWAPKAVIGQHTTANLQEMVGQLRKLKAAELGYNDFVALLNQYGDIAASRTKSRK